MVRRLIRAGHVPPCVRRGLKRIEDQVRNTGHDLAGVCDAYLFLVNWRGTLLKAHELSTAPVAAELLAGVVERFQVDATAPLRLRRSWREKG